MYAPALAPALALTLGSVLTSIAPCAHAQDSSAAGTYRVSTDRTTVNIPEWGSDCGPRPAAHTAPSGREVTVTADGSHLTLQDGRRRQRTDGCFSENPRMRRISASRAGNRWTVVCQTPDAEYQREQGTYTLTAEATRITLRDETSYSWQLRGSNCRASAMRSVVYDRTGPAPTVTVDAGTTATVTPPVNRCATPGAPARLEVTPSRRAVAPGGRGCFRARVLDANGCEVRTNAPSVTLQASRSGTELAPEGSCFRTPSSAPVGEYTVTATAGALSDRAVLAIVTVEELRSLVAQQIEEDDADAGTLADAGTASGEGVGAMAVHVPPPPAPERTSAWVWVLAALGGLLALGGIALLARRGPKDGTEPAIDPYAPLDTGNEGLRARKDAVPLPSVHTSPVTPATAATPTTATAPVERPRNHRCPVCNQRFTGENAFCPEHGAKLINEAATTTPAVPAVPVVPTVPVAPAAGPPVVAATTAEPAAALPLVCPTCGRRFADGIVFCGEDGSALRRA